jgi:hypothetical protein
MKVFALQTPIMNKIKFIINQKIVSEEIDADINKIKFIDFEPPEGFFDGSDLQGAIAVYSPSITFSESGGSATETQQSDSIIRVDQYGFGAPLKNEDNPEGYNSSVREAQKRGQVLTICAFRAIMDRREAEGSPSEGIEKSYGTDLDIGANKYPQSIQKFTPQGATISDRGSCIYRSEFKFKLDEAAINEELGVAFDGSDNIQTDTTNPI